ncbi:MAG TPA: hypothetical protein DCR10_05325 [Acidimicrobiaceae bacterium]|nr:hypothetical protein [Acidimicrobiaceae bacterium]
MRVAITGATGLIGSHCTAQALAAGHDVRMVVRNPAKAADSLVLHGLSPNDAEVYEADLDDHDRLAASLDDIECLIHAGAVFSLDPRQASNMRSVNPRSTRVLLDEAARRDLFRVIHVSSMGVYAADRTNVTPDSPTGPECGAYTGSKISADTAAVTHQEAGRPVVVVCPGGVLGPLDPSPELSDSMAMMRDWVRMRTVALPRSLRIGFVDVRDVAAVCVGALDTGPAPARHLLAGHLSTMAEVLATTAELTGRRVRVLGSPAWPLLAMGAVCDLVARTTGNKMPLTAETARLTVGNARAGGLRSVDQSSAADAFGFPSITLRQTLTDTIRWMHDAGHLDSQTAGVLAG